MVVKHALIQKGKIVKIRNVPDDDTLIVKKMLAHGYLPVNEEAIPTFDYITQSCSDSYEISVDKVTRKWTVSEQHFDEAKRMKEEEIKSKALDYIRVAFDDNGNSVVSETLAVKKTEFMTALLAAKTNIDLRNIYVEYEKAEKKKIEVM